MVSPMVAKASIGSTVIEGMCLSESWRQPAFAFPTLHNQGWCGKPWWERGNSVGTCPVHSCRPRGSGQSCLPSGSWAVALPSQRITGQVTSHCHLQTSVPRESEPSWTTPGYTSCRSRPPPLQSLPSDRGAGAETSGTKASPRKTPPVKPTATAPTPSPTNSGLYSGRPDFSLDHRSISNAESPPPPPSSPRSASSKPERPLKRQTSASSTTSYWSEAGRDLSVFIRTQRPVLPPPDDSDSESEDSLYSNRTKSLSQLVDRNEVTKVRARLSKKLSDANMYNRHLLREVAERDSQIRESKKELASMELELKALVSVAGEVAALGGKPGRKINGKYLHSHLAGRLEVLHSRLRAQIAEADLLLERTVPIEWHGMAEDVKVMGSFDGWTRGEQLSPTETGSFTRFSTDLKLRPGRYEIKFVVDGGWQLAPGWPVVGQGHEANNLLTVE